MALHRLTHVVIGVPDTAAVTGFYRDFGLAPGEDGDLSTTDGGAQLRIRQAPTRRVIEIGVGVDDQDDLGRVQSNLARMDIEVYRTNAGWLSAVDHGTGVRVRLAVASRLVQAPAALPAYNVPGNPVRGTGRATGVLRDSPVRPRKLGHVVVGSVDQARSQAFFVDGLGFKVSDSVIGRAAFLRCSTDHHNVLIQNSPARFLHHTSWQVDDVDEVGRGATAMLYKDPARHTWGLGRHHIGSNFFWYLRDPCGNFAEYYSDLDCILDDQLWDPTIFESWNPASFSGRVGLYNWGPPPPPSFLKPEDLAELMAGAHA
jgi:catechol 2,3-dioxygenase-like lactoylglutathione lyase family enzyme